MHEQDFDNQQMLHFFKQLWHTSSEPFWICKPVGNDVEMVAANHAALQLEPRQIPGSRLSDLVGSGPQWEQLVADYQRCLQSGETLVVPQHPEIQGKQYYFEAILVPVKDQHNKVSHIWGTARDFTRFFEAENALRKLNQELEDKVAERTAELNQAMARLQHLSFTDVLTGLANRRHFDQVLEQQVTRLKRHAGMLSLLMLDIDDFKYFNDCYGHLVGDNCLQQIATVLRSSLKRPTDLAARYGGEEFAIILPDTGAKGAHTLAEDIRHAVAALTIEHHGAKIEQHVTVSIGLTSCALRAEAEPEQLINTADTMLYKAKSQGKNTLIYSDTFVRPDN